MTKEFRRITFSKKTLRKAIDDYPAVAGDAVPDGDIVSIKSVRDGDDFLFELGLFDYASQENEKFYLPEPEILEVLIRYCIANKVVLPRNSRKSARLTDGNLSLDIFMGIDEDSNFER